MAEFTGADLQRMFEDVDEWVRRLTSDQDVFGVAPGSSLAGDNAKTDPYHVSHAVARNIHAAVDNLHALRCLLVDAKVMHTYAPFTILRAAYENACTAVWMIGGATRQERVTRRLRLMYKDIGAGITAMTLAGAQPPRSKAEREQQLDGIATAAGVAPVDARKRVGFEEIVRGASTAMGTDTEDTGALLWRACSALAHGDAWASYGLLDVEQLGRSWDGALRARMSAPDKLLIEAAALSRVMTLSAWNLFGRQAANHLS